MKTKWFLASRAFALVIALMTSCINDEDFGIPKSLGDEENKALVDILAQIEKGNLTLVSIADVKGLYQNDMPHHIETNIVLKGYVSSSDQSGNFFKELYLQDAPEHPSSGIKIISNQIDYYNQYNLGREVYIKLKGLYVGEERIGNEVIAIGGNIETNAFGTTVVRLSENQRKATLFRSEHTLDIIPKSMAFAQVTAKHIGLCVKFENVEFANNLNGLRYFDPIQDFDTQRNLQSCTGFDYGKFILETSSFASFKDEYLPSGNGSISGIITKDFTGSTLLMALNTTRDVDFTKDRCSLYDPSNFSTFFEETFESMSNNALVSGNGWTNFAEAGSSRWRIKTTTDSGNSGSKVAWMGAFNSGALSNITWLISPAIALESQHKKFATFKSSNDFADQSELELLISTNWDGNVANITSSTWTALPGAIVSDGEYYQNWVDSGLVDLSPFSGTAYIAFKYVGGDNDANSIDGNFEIDNFKILIQH